jgi:hypothetical protein
MFFHPKLMDFGIIIMAILLFFSPKALLNSDLMRLLNKFLWWAGPSLLLMAKESKGPPLIEPL